MGLDMRGAQHAAWELLDAAPDAMLVVGTDERIAFANRRAEGVFGFTREELLGLHVEQLIPERFRHSHHKHVARFFEKPAARSGEGGHLELFGRRKDGSEIPIEVSLSPMPTAAGLTVCVAIRDVTDRKRVESVLKLTAARFTRAIESIEDAVALYDADTRLVLCNDAFRRLLGVSSSGVLFGESHRSILEAWTKRLVFTSGLAREQFRATALTRGGCVKYEARTLDGRMLRVTQTETSDAGLVQTIWDVTEDARREEALAAAHAVARAASSAKSDFLSAMSHELRTPLNAILGFAQLMRRDRKVPLPERHQDRVSHILRGGEHLLRLIDEVLDLARIEARGIDVSVEPISLDETLREVKATLEPIAAAAGITLTFDASGRSVMGDRFRLKQILMNFASNAIKYGRWGGSVRITTTLREPWIRITVADDGIGIPASKQHTIFRPFQRAGQEAGGIEGVGLGLAICQKLAELMTGRVGFDSRERQGSKFWVELLAGRSCLAAEPAHIDARTSAGPR